MIDDQRVKATELPQRVLDNFSGERGVTRVASQCPDLLWTLSSELLQGALASRYEHNIVRAADEILCDRFTDA